MNTSPRSASAWARWSIRKDFLASGNKWDVTHDCGWTTRVDLGENGHAIDEAEQAHERACGALVASPLRHVPDGDGGYLCECPDSECCPEDRSNPLGPHVQVVKGWLDDNGCLLPDPDGIAYRRTFTDWEQVPDAE